MRFDVLLLFYFICNGYFIHNVCNGLEFINTYGDNMVLQQSPEYSTINGLSNENEITLILTKQSSPNIVLQKHNVNVNITSKEWQVLLNPIQASFDSYTIIVNDTLTQSIQLNNVVFGDVYVCSGQSNMQFTVASAFNSTQEIMDANNYPYIRVFTAQLEQSNSEQANLISIMEPWSVANNDSIGNNNWTYFSAVCWFFGKNLYNTLQYPIGLIDTNWGGTPIRDWMSPDAIKQCPNETIILSNNSDNVGGPAGDSILWNSMIYPFLTMTIKGVIWYQGEADSGSQQYSESYKCAFIAMINDWRLKWNMYSNTSDMFPFGFVQISVWNDHNNGSCASDDKWTQCIGAPQVRYAQTGNLGYLPNHLLPNVYMAISYDLGDPSSPEGDVHPRYKQQVSQRLSDAALNTIYGYKDIYWLGPYTTNYSCNYNVNTNISMIIIPFNNVNLDGLLMKNPTGFDYRIKTTNNWKYIDNNIFNINNDSLIIKFNGNNINGLRYNWYQACCNPLDGIYNCALYDKKSGLPAGAFIFDITC